MCKLYCYILGTIISSRRRNIHNCVCYLTQLSDLEHPLDFYLVSSEQLYEFCSPLSGEEEGNRASAEQETQEITILNLEVMLQNTR